MEFVISYTTYLNIASFIFYILKKTLFIGIYRIACTTLIIIGHYYFLLFIITLYLFYYYLLN